MINILLALILPLRHNHTMHVHAAAVRKSTFIISSLSMLPHLFCCGIPAIMALISLGTTVGLAGVLASNPLYQFVDKYHEILITLAVSSVLLSGFLNLWAARLDARAAAQLACRHPSCKPKKTSNFSIFYLSCALLMLDLAWFATEKFGLGLHQH